jgi:Uma2 family endonuclease
MEQLARRLVSEAKFGAIPETTQRLELFDGELILLPRPSYQHQEILSRLVVALRQWAATQGRAITVGLAPLDVRFGPDPILQPDAFVLFEVIPAAHEGPIESVPSLCIEVLSSNRAYDRLSKRFAYAEAGVSELWTVEPTGCVERWTGVGLSQSELLAETLRSPLMPGFELDLAQLRIAWGIASARRVRCGVSEGRLVGV